MKTIILNLCLILIISPQLARGQVSVSGEITPVSMFRINDGSLINLPFRLGNITLGYAIGDFELVTNTSIETRWEDADYDADMLQFREAYLMWYPSFGEVKLGKMIQAWGAADANNPTDNLSPYDFYYMFLTGTDRKLGNFGLSAKTYFGDWQLETIYTPEHLATRLPFDEPEFPISFPFEPEAYEELESPAEYGFRLQGAFNIADVSISYLNGHDQIFSPLSLSRLPSGVAGPLFGYRNTNVTGLDFVAFPGNWTVRGEGAYFSTSTPTLDPMAFAQYPVEAKYLQYVFQLEYQFANQVSLMAQFLGTEVLDASGDLMDITNPMAPVELTTDNFTAGLGTPFGMISDQVVILSSMLTLFDNSLEIRGMEMINLAETGYMTSFGSSYSIIEGLKLDATLAHFVGGDEVDNSFKLLEDFSNISLGLTYSF